LVKSLGGEKKFGLDTELPLLHILESNGVQDALWALRASNKPEVARFIAADLAEHVLPIFEAKYPDDKRPRKAIKVARMKNPKRAAYAADAAAKACLLIVFVISHHAAADARERAWQVDCLKKWFLE
jgi:hypothetical protein